MVARKREKTQRRNMKTQPPRGTIIKRKKLKKVVKQQGCKTVTVPVYNPADKYINIFTEIDISNWLSPEQSMYEPELGAFKRNSHKYQYDKFEKLMERQLKFFRVKSEEQVKQLKVECTLCNTSMKCLNASKHCILTQHLFKLMEPFVNGESKKYLKQSNILFCSLCNVRLFSEPCLSLAHFQSQTHCENISKLPKGAQVCKRNVEKNGHVVISEMDASPSLKQKESVACEQAVSTAPFSSLEHSKSEANSRKLEAFHACRRSEKYEELGKEITDEASKLDALTNTASVETRQETDSVKSSVQSERVIMEIGNVNSSEAPIFGKDPPPILHANPSHNFPSSNHMPVSVHASRSSTLKNINFVDENMRSQKLSMTFLVPLENARLLQLPPNSKRGFEALAMEIGAQVNFFVVECPTEILICTLCKKPLKNKTELWQHIESRCHFLNMLLPLINVESRHYLNFVNKNFYCCLCNTVLYRAQNLLQHFESSSHISKLQFRSSKVKEQQTPTISQQPNSLSAELEAFRSTQKTMTLFSPFLISEFVKLAFNIKHEINFFSFKASEELTIDCMPCKCSFQSTQKAIDHVQQKIHKQNADRYKKDLKVEPWIPSVCDDNWQFLWPVVKKLEVYCTLCCVNLSNRIFGWIQHFRSLHHSRNKRNLHRNLTTAESFPSKRF